MGGGAGRCGRSSGRAGVFTGPMNRMEAKLSDDLRPKAAVVEHENMEREVLLALLEDVTKQRDKVLSQYEAMALQVDQSIREVDDALLDARHNAKRAEESERRAEREAARATELALELDEERRKGAEIAAAFACFREALMYAPVEDPWGALSRAASQIVDGWVAWARAEIPADSPLLPWFDRTVALAKTTTRLALKWTKAFLAWTKPRVSRLWLSLKSEVSRRLSKK
jgi:hypothetical protein